MHTFYLFIISACLLETVIKALGQNPFRALDINVGYWFWFLVMYYYPVEDAAIAMICTAACRSATYLVEILEILKLPGHRQVQSLNDYFVSLLEYEYLSLGRFEKLNR